MWGRGVVLCCMFVVVLVVGGDERKMILSIAICHQHESAAWAACEVGDLWQANKRKAAKGLKGEFLGGVLRVLGFSLGILITTPPGHTSHCWVPMPCHNDPISSAVKSIIWRSECPPVIPIAQMYSGSAGQGTTRSAQCGSTAVPRH